MDLTKNRLRLKLEDFFFNRVESVSDENACYYLGLLFNNELPPLIFHILHTPSGEEICSNKYLAKFLYETFRTKETFINCNTAPFEIYSNRQHESDLSTLELNSLSILKLERKFNNPEYDKIFTNVRTQKVCHIKVFSNSADDLQSYADRIRYCNSIHR